MSVYTLRPLHATGYALLRLAAIPVLVAGYIFAAYWFTASTSFANPAVTLARCLTQTFAGIRPADVIGFVLAQMAGMLAACATAILLDSPQLTTR